MGVTLPESREYFKGRCEKHACNTSTLLLGGLQSSVLLYASRPGKARSRQGCDSLQREFSLRRDIPAQYCATRLTAVHPPTALQVAMAS